MKKTFLLILPVFIFGGLVLSLFTFQKNTQAQNIGSFSGVVAPGFSFKKDLKLGDTDPDVKELQKMLNNDVATVVAIEGIGSRGQENTYFDEATKNAVIRFQNKYKDVVLTLNSLTEADGVVNKATRTKLNLLIGVITTYDSVGVPQGQGGPISSTPGQNNNNGNNNIPPASNQNPVVSQPSMNTCQLIDLLINVGAIAPNKASQARSVGNCSTQSSICQLIELLIDIDAIASGKVTQARAVGNCSAINRGYSNDGGNNGGNRNGGSDNWNGDNGGWGDNGGDGSGGSGGGGGGDNGGGGSGDPDCVGPDCNVIIDPDCTGPDCDVIINPSASSSNPISVDLKINGRDNYTVVSGVEDLTFSWTSKDASSCSVNSSPVYSGWSGNNKSTSGTERLKSNYSSTFTMYCFDRNSTFFNLDKAILTTPIGYSYTPGGNILPTTSCVTAPCADLKIDGRDSGVFVSQEKDSYEYTLSGFVKGVQNCKLYAESTDNQFSVNNYYGQNLYTPASGKEIYKLSFPGFSYGELAPSTGVKAIKLPTPKNINFSLACEDVTNPAKIIKDTVYTNFSKDLLPKLDLKVAGKDNYDLDINENKDKPVNVSWTSSGVTECVADSIKTKGKNSAGTINGWDGNKKKANEDEDLTFVSADKVVLKLSCNDGYLSDRNSKKEGVYKGLVDFVTTNIINTNTVPDRIKFTYITNSGHLLEFVKYNGGDIYEGGSIIDSNGQKVCGFNANEDIRHAVNKRRVPAGPALCSQGHGAPIVYTTLEGSQATVFADGYSQRADEQVSGTYQGIFSTCGINPDGIAGLSTEVISYQGGYNPPTYGSGSVKCLGAKE